MLFRSEYILLIVFFLEMDQAPLGSLKACRLQDPETGFTPAPST